MAFADPQTVTISGVTATSYLRTGFSPVGVFTTADQLNKLTIQHSPSAKKVRHFIRLDNSKIASDPLMAGQSVPVSIGAYLVVDVPTVGFTATEAKAAVDGFLAFLTASSGAKVTQLLAGEL
jgi:hypothetical protein